MNKNLFGQFIPTGTLREQLQQVKDVYKCQSATELFRKWAEVQYPQLNEWQIRDIVSADRIAREI